MGGRHQIDDLAKGTNSVGAAVDLLLQTVVIKIEVAPHGSTGWQGCLPGDDVEYMLYRNSSEFQNLMYFASALHGVWWLYVLPTNVSIILDAQIRPSVFGLVSLL